MKQPGYAALLVAASLFFGLGISEVVLRMTMPALYPIAGWRTQIPPDPYDPVPPNDKNQLGLRGQRIAYDEGDAVVVLVGDSQVQAIAQIAADMPERTLERYLNVLAKRDRGTYRVFSIAAGGWGQDQELLMLEEFLRTYRADHVVVWMTWENDLFDNTFPTRFPTGHRKPTFWLDQGTLVGPDIEMDDYLSTWHLPYWTKLVLFGTVDSVWEKKLPPAYVPLADYTGPVNHTWEMLRRQGKFHDNFTNEKAHGAIALSPSSPRTTYSLDLTRALLLRMHAAAQRAGADCSVFAVRRVNMDANQHHSVVAAVHSAMASNSESVYTVDGKLYRLSSRQMDKNIAYARRALRYFEVPLELKNWAVSDNDRHLNAATNDLAMLRLAKALLAIEQDNAINAPRLLKELLQPLPQLAFEKHWVPGRIQFEHYDLGGPGISYYDADTGNQGNAFRGDAVDLFGNSQMGLVGWTTPGEWLEYTVKTPPHLSEHHLRVTLRATNRSGTTANLTVLTQTGLTATLAIPASKNWEDFKTVFADGIKLPHGESILRWEITSHALGLDWFELRPLDIPDQGYRLPADSHRVDLVAQERLRSVHSAIP